MVDDCLSRCIDLFDDILNNELDVSSIVNKAFEEICELDSRKTIIIRQRIHYLRMLCVNILNSDINQPVPFAECCKKAIKKWARLE